MPDPPPDSITLALIRSRRSAPVVLARFVALFAFVLLGGTLTEPLFAQGAAADMESPARSEAALLAVFFGLLLASAVTSGSETAIFSLNKLDLVRARARPSRTTRAVLYLLDHPNDTLTTLLVMNNGINVALSLTAGALSEIYFGGGEVGGYAVAAFGTTAFLLVFGEVLPKTISHLRAHIVANVVAFPIFLMTFIFIPIRAVMNRFIRWVFRRLNVPESRMSQIVSEEELKAMINAREVSTLLEEDEREMIHGVFDLRHTFAEEIMVPRGEVAALPDGLSQEEMLAKLRETPHARILIYRDNLDHLLGYVLAKQVLLEPARDWKKFIRDAPCVPMRVRLVDLLTQFRRRSTKLAVLVDEYGGVAGIVTLHDLLEEIVGDMAEFHEPVEHEYQEIEPGRWRVRGRMNLDELGEAINVSFPDDMGTTIAGFFMNMLGQVPSVGAEYQYNGVLMKVTRMVGRRIMLLELTRTEEPAEVQAARGGEEQDQ